MVAVLELLWIFGIVALTVLLVAYIFERCYGATWSGLHRPFTLRQLVREWLLYMVLFAGLGTLLERVLKLACSVGC